MIFLGVGLILIIGLSILERVRERPSFDWSRSFRQSPLFPETDLQVEGLARSGDVRQAIAMFQRLHKVDQKKAQRAVSLLANGQREQAAALARTGPSVLPAQAFSRRNTKLGQLAEAMAAMQAAKNAAGRRRTRLIVLVLGTTSGLLAQTPKLGTISFPPRALRKPRLPSSWSPVSTASNTPARKRPSGAPKRSRRTSPWPTGARP